MPLGPVQRYPIGLTELLGFKGLSPPSMFSELVHGSIDLLQFYGQTQLQRRLVNNAALAQGGTLTLAVPSTENWVLFGVAAVAVITAPVTAFGVSLARGLPGNSVPFANAITPSGFIPAVASTQQWGWTAPTPQLLLPTTEILLRLDTLIGVANANVTLSAAFGVLA